jgi:hypothetical protein
MARPLNELRNEVGSMKPDELFGVGVRWIGLICALTGLPALLQFNYGAAISGAGQVVLGLLLMTRADAIVRVCYPKTKDLTDFRDS